MREGGVGRDGGLVRELVGLGLQGRSGNKLRGRQPRARADSVMSGGDAEGVERYAELSTDELKVHEVRWLEPGAEGEAVSYALKPNFRGLRRMWRDRPQLHLSVGRQFPEQIGQLHHKLHLGVDRFTRVHPGDTVCVRCGFLLDG